MTRALTRVGAVSSACASRIGLGEAGGLAGRILPQLAGEQPQYDQQGDDARRYIGAAHGVLRFVSG